MGTVSNLSLSEFRRVACVTFLFCFVLFFLVCGVVN